MANYFADLAIFNAERNYRVKRAGAVFAAGIST